MRENECGSIIYADPQPSLLGIFYKRLECKFFPNFFLQNAFKFLTVKKWGQRNKLQEKYWPEEKYYENVMTETECIE